MWDTKYNVEEEDVSRVLSLLLNCIAEEDCPYNCCGTGLSSSRRLLCPCVIEFFTKSRAKKKED